jgi:hypothetical protein
MLETVFGISASTSLGVIGILAALVSIVTEVLKKIIPNSFPTKALVIIISLILTIGFILIFCTLSLKLILLGIVGSFVVAFIAMYGWDTFKEIITKFKYPL